MKKENIIQSIKVVTLGLMVAVGISYAFAWTAPKLPPPGGNVPAPVNVGDNTQYKEGSLWSNNFLGSLGGGYFGGDLEIANGKGITLGGEYKTAWPSEGSSTPTTPTVLIFASPTIIPNNTASAITWSSTDATGCTASDGWSGSKATSGSVSTGNLTSSQTYSLYCTGAGGNSGTMSATVMVPDYYSGWSSGVYDPYNNLGILKLDTCNGSRTNPYTCLPADVKSCTDVSGWNCGQYYYSACTYVFRSVICTI